MPSSTDRESYRFVDGTAGQIVHLCSSCVIQDWVKCGCLCISSFQFNSFQPKNVGLQESELGHDRPIAHNSSGFAFKYRLGIVEDQGMGIIQIALLIHGEQNNVLFGLPGPFSANARFCRETAIEFVVGVEQKGAIGIQGKLVLDRSIFRAIVPGNDQGL